ncbi:thioredoxin-dependent thiol peroxidase [Bacteroidetes bacterium endosymbiont of Geopemphigus sp.]|uniref:thioredoxin-dependent thiol peroxidase n=1 Tax=Bacteroidetes bacterium endosymbiont of Geopemphigus sp. TaxID=2047937 RepID=UPI000CD07CB5|nr:thioredoxin-dependent thiol peroxidase [Bacteroidetes bacterium endosymbiont of Geopemphigus sp.]
MLKAGDKIPHFDGVDQDGKKINVTDYRGKKLIIFFYPRASTPGCTAEACSLRDYYQSLQDQNYELLGVSADSPERQKKFRENYRLPFLLLADEGKEVIRAFEAWGSKKFLGKSYEGILRKTFIIDEKGYISRIIDNVKTKDHALQIMKQQ